MKKFFLSVVICSVCFLSAVNVSASHTIVKSDKGNVDFYGFVKLDVYHQDGGVNVRTAPMFATPSEDTDFHLNANTSRFGFKWSGFQLENGWSLGAVLEFDLFDTSSRNKMKVRDRLMAFTLSKGNSSWLIGQHWDIFSPVNGTTLVTIGNFYKSGNTGFRRTQLRYTYSKESFNWAFAVNDPTTEDGIESGSPLLTSRLGFSFDSAVKGKIGISAASGQETKKAVNYETDVDVFGVCFDWALNLSKNLQFKGEYTTGENLATFMSRSGIINNVEEMMFEGQEMTAFWAEIVYSYNKYSFYLSCGQESMSDETQLSSGDLEDTSFIVGGAQYKFSSSVTFGLEISKLESEYYLTGDSDTTNQLIFSAIYKF